MDRIALFRSALEEIIAEYAELPPVNLDVQAIRIQDTERGHYQLLWVGWDGWNRVCSISFHVDIKEGKLYIQEDRTEESIAAELKKRGVREEELLRCYREKHPRQAIEMADSPS